MQSRLMLGTHSLIQISKLFPVSMIRKMVSLIVTGSERVEERCRQENVFFLLLGNGFLGPLEHACIILLPLSYVRYSERNESLTIFHG